jgi:hypothetical protein
VFHCYSLVAKAKTHNPFAFWSNAMPSLAHSTLGTSCAVACATNEFLDALSTALIDAIPLSVLSKLRNPLWFGSPIVGATGGF